MDSGHLLCCGGTVTQVVDHVRIDVSSTFLHLGRLLTIFLLSHHLRTAPSEMTDIGRGLPLLSGPPPLPESSSAENACRKCNKEFNVIFTRSRRCNHCGKKGYSTLDLSEFQRFALFAGYSYCHSCSDYQALMPRSGAETGYDAMNVCSFCIEFLTSMFPISTSSDR